MSGVCESHQFAPAVGRAGFPGDEFSGLQLSLIGTALAYLLWFRGISMLPTHVPAFLEGGESPPEDAYSRLSHFERFAPLHDVALELIEWLRSAFDVDVDQSPSVAADLLSQPRDVFQAVRLVPRWEGAAPLTFVLTGFPGVFLQAGSLHDFHFPECGCDACDDTVTDLLDKLEWTVRTVVSGG